MEPNIERIPSSGAAVLARLSRETFVETYAPLGNAEEVGRHVEQTFTERKVADAMNRPGSDFFWIVEEEEPIAFMKVNRKGAQTEPGLDDKLEIEQIYVRSSHQGRGLGRRLMDRAMELASEWGLAGIWLGVWENNPDAIAFYEHLGFTAVGEHMFRVGSEQHRDIILARGISSARPDR
jgi:ribosomal protein S18 acetylase RimI-like enzyme